MLKLFSQCIPKPFSNNVTDATCSVILKLSHTYVTPYISYISSVSFECNISSVKISFECKISLIRIKFNISPVKLALPRNLRA